MRDGREILDSRNLPRGTNGLFTFPPTEDGTKQLHPTLYNSARRRTAHIIISPRARAPYSSAIALEQRLAIQAAAIYDLHTCIKQGRKQEGPVC